jgi:hypothetical protein
VCGGLSADGVCRYKFNDDTVQRVAEKHVVTERYSQLPGTPVRRGAYGVPVSSHSALGVRAVRCACCRLRPDRCAQATTAYMLVYRRMRTRFVPGLPPPDPADQAHAPTLAAAAVAAKAAGASGESAGQAPSPAQEESAPGLEPRSPCMPCVCGRPCL